MLPSGQKTRISGHPARCSARCFGLKTTPRWVLQHDTGPHRLVYGRNSPPNNLKSSPGPTNARGAPRRGLPTRGAPPAEAYQRAGRPAQRPTNARFVPPPSKYTTTKPPSEPPNEKCITDCLVVTNTEALVQRLFKNDCFNAQIPSSAFKHRRTLCMHAMRAIHGT